MELRNISDEDKYEIIKQYAKFTDCYPFNTPCPVEYIVKSYSKFVSESEFDFLPDEYKINLQEILSVIEPIFNISSCIVITIGDIHVLRISNFNCNVYCCTIDLKLTRTKIIDKKYFNCLPYIAASGLIVGLIIGQYLIYQE